MKERSDLHEGRLLAIYLNDHLTGANAGVSLIRRTARHHRDGELGPQLERLARQIAEDRDSLREVMTALDIPAMHLRAVLGRIGELAGRLKLNGRLVSRSPLSDVLELEAMRLGVEGKTAAWRSLQSLASTDARLDRGSIDRLLERAQRQSGLLESLRTAASDRLFAPSVRRGRTSVPAGSAPGAKAA
ncbi:hypothetical protein HYE82_22095 [Streptomyces sp. BR123]|uniref:hypothetical protein n=1 Tax=Streptomyces sp. BR123 TaxID=2749828 RepID=UPI0015C48196|nr:hypothetical protein [Streptomyces sp. BR123]NXY97023.1 hypothetical protein [Streptomyces sp. BR123]